MKSVVEPFVVRPACVSSIVVVVLLLCVTCAGRAAVPVRIPLWEEGAPGTPATRPEDEPALYLTRPAAHSAAAAPSHRVPMQDGQRAVRPVRTRASESGVDPAKIGVLGFSAGGHLASTLGTH